MSPPATPRYAPQNNAPTSTKTKRRLTMLGEGALSEYMRLDLAVEDAIQHENVSCKKGCAGCCKQLIQASVAEVAAIAVAYPNKFLQRKRKILAQAKWLETEMKRVFGPQMADNGAGIEIASDEDMAAFSAKNETLANLWWETGQSCVFLKEDNTCAVYDARPIACRTYYVISDPALCHAELGTEVSVIHIHAGHRTRLRLAGSTVSLSYLPNLLRMTVEALDK